MKNVYKELVKSYTDEAKQIRNKLYNIGINEGIIKELYLIIKYAEPMFKKPKEDDNNEYVRGLYAGAVHQAKHMVNKLIESKIKSIVINEDTNNLTELVKDLYNIDQLLDNVFYDDEYEINIAVKLEAVFAEHEEDYYIVAQKDNNNKDFEYSYIGYNSVELYAYKPTIEEIEAIENAI